MRQKSFREKLEIELKAILLACVIVAGVFVVLSGTAYYWATAHAHTICGYEGGELVGDACLVEGVEI